MTSTNEFQTRDLYYASYLQASGLEMLRTDPDPDGRRFQFVFRADADLQELKQEWINCTGLVNAQDYAQAIRTLKSLVHQM